MNKLAKTLMVYMVVAGGALSLYGFGSSASDNTVNFPSGKEGFQRDPYRRTAGAPPETYIPSQRYYFLGQEGKIFRFDTLLGEVHILDERRGAWVLIDLPEEGPGTGENLRNINSLVDLNFSIGD